MARSLADLPPKQQWMVAGLLSVALVAIYYLQFYRPNAQQIGRMQGEIISLRGEVQEMQAVAADLPTLRDELDGLQQRLTVLGHILPADYETADLLRGVGTLAAQSNLTIRDLEFKDPVAYDFYAESPIELELTGSYHDLARFFDRIGKYARIINVDQVEIDASDEPGDATVTAKVTAVTFFFLESEQAPDEAQDYDELLKQ